MKSIVSAPASSCKIESLGHRIDGENTFRAQEEGAPDGKLPDRSAAPNRDSLAALQIAEVGRHVAGGKDVGQEEDLLVAEVPRHLDRAHVGIWHPEILRLAAGVASEEMRVAKQTSG